MDQKNIELPTSNEPLELPKADELLGLGAPAEVAEKKLPPPEVEPLLETRDSIKQLPSQSQ